MVVSPDTTGPETDIPSPVSTELPLGSVHLTTGVMSAVALQVRVYEPPALKGFEGPSIDTLLFSSVHVVCAWM